MSNALHNSSGFLLSEDDVMYARQVESYGFWHSYASRVAYGSFRFSIFENTRAQEPDLDDWVTAELLGLVDLDENWDGHGAYPPTPKALETVSTFLKPWNTRPCRPSIMGTPEGGVLLEWDTDDVDLTLEFDELGRTIAYVKTQYAECEGPVTEHWNIVVDAISRLWSHD